MPNITNSNIINHSTYNSLNNSLNNSRNNSLNDNLNCMNNRPKLDLTVSKLRTKDN